MTLHYVNFKIKKSYFGPNIYFNAKLAKTRCRLLLYQTVQFGDAL